MLLYKLDINYYVGLHGIYHIPTHFFKKLKKGLPRFSNKTQNMQTIQKIRVSPFLKKNPKHTTKQTIRVNPFLKKNPKHATKQTIRVNPFFMKNPK